jgi:hypothetical protein
MKFAYYIMTVVLMGVLAVLLGTIVYSDIPPIDRNFTYMPHWVTFHIYPEKEGISVAALATDEFPPTAGRTDNKSEVSFPMISSAKYNILIGNNRCSYYIYPKESYYVLKCGDRK